MRVHRFIAIVVTALALTMTSAHVLEMPRKLSYDLDLYTRVNGSLYLYFAVVGGAYQILSIIAVGTLAWRVRHERHGRWTIAAANALALSFVSWLLLVEPVNLAIGDGATWTNALRLRWELGHLVGFVLSLGGFVLLIVGTLGEIPGDLTDEPSARPRGRRRSQRRPAPASSAAAHRGA